MARKALFFLIICFVFSSVAAYAQSEFDHTHTRWSMVLQKVVKDGKIDYVSIVRDPADLEQYAKEMGKLKKGDYEKFTINQKICYWVNLYNALTVLSISNNYPVVPKKPIAIYPKNSIRQIPGIWNKMRFKTALGYKTLNQILVEQIDKFREPLLNFVVVNSAMGGPKIMDRALHHEQLEDQLNDAARNFVLDAGNVRADPNNKALYLNIMFKWKAKQFIPRYFKLGHFEHRTKGEVAVLNFLNNYAGMMEKMMIYQDDYQIRYIEYDWTLNER